VRLTIIEVARGVSAWRDAARRAQPGPSAARCFHKASSWSIPDSLAANDQVLVAAASSRKYPPQPPNTRTTRFRCRSGWRWTSRNIFRYRAIRRRIYRPDTTEVSMISATLLRRDSAHVRSDALVRLGFMFRHLDVFSLQAAAVVDRRLRRPSAMHSAKRRRQRVQCSYIRP